MNVEKGSSHYGKAKEHRLFDGRDCSDRRRPHRFCGRPGDEPTSSRLPVEVAAVAPEGKAVYDEKKRVRPITKGPHDAPVVIYEVSEFNGLALGSVRPLTRFVRPTPTT